MTEALVLSTMATLVCFLQSILINPYKFNGDKLTKSLMISRVGKRKNKI